MRRTFVLRAQGASLGLRIGKRLRRYVPWAIDGMACYMDALTNRNGEHIAIVVWPLSGPHNGKLDIRDVVQLRLFD